MLLHLKFKRRIFVFLSGKLCIDRVGCAADRCGDGGNRAGCSCAGYRGSKTNINTKLVVCRAWIQLVTTVSNRPLVVLQMSAAEGGIVDAMMLSPRTHLTLCTKREDEEASLNEIGYDDINLAAPGILLYGPPGTGGCTHTHPATIAGDNRSTIAITYKVWLRICV